MWQSHYYNKTRVRLTAMMHQHPYSNMQQKIDNPQAEEAEAAAEQCT